jgi:hypothetical protein
MEKLTVKTTGPFELRDAMQNVDIGEKEIEVLETSFVTQMIGLKRLEVVSGKVTQEADPHESTTNPALTSLPSRPDTEPTIKELVENRTPATRGRPKNS